MKSNWLFTAPDTASRFQTAGFRVVLVKDFRCGAGFDLGASFPTEEKAQ
jgi:hypothetical protein